MKNELEQRLHYEDFIDESVLEYHRSSLGEQKSAELYGQAVESASQYVSQIAEASRQGKQEDIGKYVDALAGLSADFGFNNLGETVSRVGKCSVTGNKYLLSIRAIELRKAYRITCERLSLFLPQATEVADSMQIVDNAVSKKLPGSPL